MWKESRIRIVLYLLLEEKKIECLTDTGSSFHEILNFLDHRGCMHFNKQMIILEKGTHLCCDADVSLSSMHVLDGMVFYVY